MKIAYNQFGCIEIEGETYQHDVVIKRGKVHRRRKEPSKAYKESGWHTPLTAHEHIPWGKRGGVLIVGTGQTGLMPIHESVYTEAEERGITVSVMKTEEACRRIAEMEPDEVNAVLHVTC